MGGCGEQPKGLYISYFSNLLKIKDLFGFWVGSDKDTVGTFVGTGPYVWRQLWRVEMISSCYAARVRKADIADANNADSTAAGGN